MMYGAAMGWVWIWVVLVVVGLLIIGYVAVRLARGGWAAGPRPGSGSGSVARRVLDERYARGEIDEEEYRRRGDLLP